MKFSSIVITALICRHPSSGPPLRNLITITHQKDDVRQMVLTVVLPLASDKTIASVQPFWSFLIRLRVKCAPAPNPRSYPRRFIDVPGSPLIMISQHKLFYFLPLRALQCAVYVLPGRGRTTRMGTPCGHSADIKIFITVTFAAPPGVREHQYRHPRTYYGRGGCTSMTLLLQLAPQVMLPSRLLKPGGL
jgi:hypothetical protein